MREILDESSVEVSKSQELLQLSVNPMIAVYWIPAIAENG